MSIVNGDSYLQSLSLFWSDSVLENIVSSETNSYPRLMSLIFERLRFTIYLDSKDPFFRIYGQYYKFYLKDCKHHWREISESYN